MSGCKNIIGQRFGRLVVLEKHGNKCLCKCDCGNEKEVSYNSMIIGHTKSCGCLVAEELLRRKEISQNKVCEICGKRGNKIMYSKITNQYLCSRHYQQVQIHGYTKKTTQEPNDIVLFDDYAEIILTDKFNNEIARTKIDIEDIDCVKKYRWCVHCKDGYVSTKINKHTLFIHQLVLGEMSRMVDIDHILGDTFDNRKSMLRICNHAENMQNKKINANNKSGHSGVWFDKMGKWKAYITVNKTHIHLGTFSNKQDAIDARVVAEEKYFGEFVNKRVS